MHGIWRLPKVMEFTQLSESTIRRRMREGSFPLSRPLGNGKSRAIGWDAAEVEAWAAGLFRRAA